MSRSLTAKVVIGQAKWGLMQLLTFIFIFILSQSLYGAPPQLRASRETARTLLQKSRCGSCHTPQWSKFPKALKVYNLEGSDWSASMSDSQLRRMYWALTQATQEELLSFGVSQSTSTRLHHNERKQIVDYLEKELAHRKKYPQERFQELAKRQAPWFF